MEQQLLRRTPIQRSLALKSFGIILALGMVGCGGGSSGNSESSTPIVETPSTPKLLATLSAVTTEPKGSNCATGGAKVNAGLDTNSNAVLDANEVTSTQFVCNGAIGATGMMGSTGLSSLVSIVPETAGTNCATGGSKISVGADTNANGILDSSEVTSANFVCQGVNGATGATGAAGTNGTNGVNGATGATGAAGTNGTNGADGATGATGAAGTNGTMGPAGPIGATGANGLTSLISISPIASGSICANGGNRVTSGVDTNGNSILDSAEITTTAYICDGIASGMNWSVITTDTQASPKRGYVIDTTSTLNVTLPTTPQVGDIVAFTAVNTGSWNVLQNAGQQILSKPLNNISGITANSNFTARQSTNQINWREILISADGKKGFGTGTGWCSTSSTNSGLNWSDSGCNNGSLQYYGGHAAISGNGQRVVVGSSGTYTGYGNVYVSTDSGASFQGPYTMHPGYTTTGMTISYDGMKVATSTSNGQIYTSTDGGVTWTPRDIVRNWSDIASSYDGTKLVAVENGGQIYTSTDSGVTWTARDNARNWISVASSSNGTKLVAVETGGQIYTSIDSGVTWTARDNVRNWSVVASSANGEKLFAAVNGGAIYQSIDSGVTWTVRSDAPNNFSWQYLSVSGDGSKVAAAAPNQYAYTTYGLGSSTLGTSGSLSGGQYDNVQLQYTGNGIFIPLEYNDYSGTLQLK